MTSLAPPRHPARRSHAIGMRVYLTTDIAAPIERVWRALTIPEEVRAWDGVVPLDVPIDYPPDALLTVRPRSTDGVRTHRSVSDSTR